MDHFLEKDMLTAYPIIFDKDRGKNKAAKPHWMFGNFMGKNLLSAHSLLNYV